MKNILLITLMVAACHLHAQIPTANLEAYYPFNGNAIDESSKNNNGTVYGASLSTDRFGNPNSAYSFDGINDAITASSVINLDTQSTFCFWILSNSSNLNAILIYEGDPGFNGFGLLQTNGVCAAGDSITGMTGGVICNFLNPGTSEANGLWQFVVLTNSGINFNLYVNSVLQVQGTSSHNLISGDLNMGGNGNDLNNNSFNGKIDDVRIYSVVLTDCEIQSLFLEGTPEMTQTESDSVCNGDNYTFPDGYNQTNITSTTIHTSHLKSSLSGCDSAAITTTLTVNPLPTVVATGETTICDGDTTSISAIGASTYFWNNGAGTGALVSVSPNTSTTYTVTGTDSNSCVNTDQVAITVTSLPVTTVNQANNVLTAQNVSAGVTYQWIDCNNGYSIIVGDTNQSFTAIMNGSYAVEVTQSGCVDTSNCFEITNLGLITSSFPNEISIFPNPTKENFTIDLGSKYDMINITVTDINGKLIQNKVFQQQQLLNLSINNTTGMHLVKIESQDKQAVIRLIKE